MKIQKTDDGMFMWWCLGCNEVHGVNSRWFFNGDLEAPTFTPSVLVTGFSKHSVERTCHSYVTNGSMQYLPDSTHELAGQTVEIPEWPNGEPS